MSIWGTILGGTAGFMLGGPIGALVGAVLGSQVGGGTAARSGHGATFAQDRQAAFAIGVVVLSAKMAKADGRVTRDEVAAFKRRFKVPGHLEKDVGRIFNEAKREPGGFEPYAEQLAGLFRDNRAVLEELVDSLFEIAKADGKLHPAELDYLRKVARIFGFSAAEFDSIHQSHTEGAKADPYTVLGLDRGASEGEIKKTYRRLVREHHPDTLIAQGMPKEFIDVANDKLAAINEAYDRVCAERGIN